LGYDVTWWDPKILNLGVRQSFGIRQEELLAKGDTAVSEEDLRRYKSWSALLGETRGEASRPSHTVCTATSAARGKDSTADALPIVEVVVLARRGERPAGTRFGTLVHATLATVALDSTTELITGVAVLQGRILGATEDEVATATNVVQTALSHPLFVRAREALVESQCRREVPVTLTQQDGRFIEGVVDLAFLEKGIWTVVDFKTDRELASGLEHYKRQVGLYCAAIARATGKQTRGIVMHL
jgi:ATP-dependent exoDNAse (exonuclease V) beta subunit